MFERFTDEARQIVVRAQEDARELRHNFIGSEHLLLGLVTVDSVAEHALVERGIDRELVLRSIVETLGRGATNTNGHVPFTPRAKKILELALREALSLGHNHIGPEHLLLGLLREGNGVGASILQGAGIDASELKLTLVDPNRERLEPTGAGTGAAAAAGGRERRGQTLERFGRNLTRAARNGELDPVIGRADETRRLMQILVRRTKNNPILIGEPGVGKTAVVEGLAQLIADGNVPKQLRDTDIVSVDLGGVIAGSRYRGDFEERIKNLLADVKAKGNVVLFFDEIHTLIGSGSSEGAVDGASLLKPMLARGELRTIGATTTDEYRKHFEKDAALARRFAPVTVDEPNPDETLRILSGVRDKFAAHHGVEITDGALLASVRLSNRYVTDRKLPDKAVDLLDEVAARAVIGAYSPERDNLLAGIETLKARLGKDHGDAAARDELDRLELQLKEFPEPGPLRVDADDVARLISESTGIPVTATSDTENSRLLTLEQHLRERVVGQDQAVAALAKAIRRSRAGLRDPRRPAGSFLFAGPSGVGKTELAKALSHELFGDEKALTVLDMSEYAEQHSVSKLFGSPPGYVGYDEGGQLTERVRRKPYSVVLLDEVEKAHPDVFNSLLQVLEEGRLTDGQGRPIDFTNVILIMTSNLGARDLAKTQTVGFAGRDGQDRERTAAKALDAVKEHFRPEFLNRVDEIVVFHRLESEHMVEIVSKLVDQVDRRLRLNGMGLEATENATRWLAAHGYDPQMGARPARRLVTREIEDRVSELILSGELSTGQIALIDADDELGILVTRSTRRAETAGLSPVP